MRFDHNGIGKLADAQSCTVTEKRNGSYELKLICPADGIHAEMLEEGNIILAKPSDTMQSQPFRIYKITTPIDGKLEVQARHISYQLNFITVSSFSVTGCVGAMQGLKSHAASDCPFNVWTDVESSATFTLGVPSSFRNCLGGMAGSVLDVFGGEFEWDRYTVRFHKARGADHNVHIIYGKNLTDFKMEKSIENTITGVHPYWVDNETQAVMELPEKVVLQSKRSIPYQKITVLDCTSNFQEKPSEAALREYAQNYIDTTDLTEPEIDIKIDFLQLWNTPGYEDIVEAERVSLCDTVHVYISKLGIKKKQRIRRPIRRERVMITSIYQEVELSLTENLIPVIVPVKQYDNRARKVRCVLYNNSVQYSVPQDCIVACSGTRPDGTIFHYTSETASDLVFVENGAVIFTITTFMTAQAGCFPLDVVMLSTAGDVLGSFSLTLKVERAAINNGKIATYTYAGVVEAIRQGLLEVYITDDGYFAVVSEDGLGFSDKSESSTIQKFIENLLNCTVTDDGYLAFSTEDGLKLIFSMDGNGRLIVEFANG